MRSPSTLLSSPSRQSSTVAMEGGPCMLQAAADSRQDDVNNELEELLSDLRFCLKRMPKWSIIYEMLLTILLDISPGDLLSPVTPSSTGAIESRTVLDTIHVPKNLSAYRPLTQRVLDNIEPFKILIADKCNILRSEEEEEGEDEFMLGTRRGSCSIQEKRTEATSNTWLVASAARHHATGNVVLLSGFKPESGGGVFVHDASGLQVLGRGAVVTDAVVLPDVWYVPGLAANLVSVSQLAELGYSVAFGRGACRVRSADGGGPVVGEARAGEGGQFEVDFLKLPLTM